MIKTKSQSDPDNSVQDVGELREYDTYFTHTGLPKKSDGHLLKLWKEINHRSMSAQDWETIVLAYKKGRQPPILAGFKTKNGTEFSAAIEIWNTASGPYCDFSPKEEGKPLSVLCPVTNEPFRQRETKNGAPYYLAKGFPGLVMFRDKHHRTILPQDWAEILKAGLQGKPGPLMECHDKEGNPYRVAFQICQNEKGKFWAEEQFEVTKTATKTICPVSHTPILESKNCYYSDAYPEMRFPKHYWGADFTPEDVCLVVQATAEGLEAPVFTLFRKDGSAYQATLAMAPDGRIVTGKVEEVEVGAPAREATVGRGIRR